MAKRVAPKRAVTPEDLESLVRALGGLVRESVREEVRDAVKPLSASIATLVAHVTGFPNRDGKFNAVHDALDAGAIDIESAKHMLEVIK
jgi:hypothetical protein